MMPAGRVAAIRAGRQPCATMMLDTINGAIAAPTPIDERINPFAVLRNLAGTQLETPLAAVG